MTHNTYNNTYTKQITPDFAIQLNDDYTISNHGIHKYVCSYYRKYKQDTTNIQSGGYINTTGGNRKLFTPSALRYLEKHNISTSEILSSISQSYNTEYYNTGTTNLNDYIVLQNGGKRFTPKVAFESNLSGKKEDIRLVYMIKIKRIIVVIKIMVDKKAALKEKRIYAFFNKYAKNDPVVDEHVLKTYETETYTTERINKDYPEMSYILLPCKIKKKRYDIKLSNKIIPENMDGMPFLKTDGILGTYDRIKDISATHRCTYTVVEVRPTYTTYQQYIDNEGDPIIIKRIIMKTANLLKYLNDMYLFNHWDLHYHNLLVRVSPSVLNGKPIQSKNRVVDICFFDFDLSAAGIYTHTDAYLSRLKKFLRRDHDLVQSYRNLLTVENINTQQNITPFTKRVFKYFEQFMTDNKYNKYKKYDIYKVIDPMSDTELEKYFRYMGRFNDLIRLMNFKNPFNDITLDDLYRGSDTTEIDENKTNIECIIVHTLMKYMDLYNHKKMAYATLLFTDFLLFLRTSRTMRKIIA